MKDGFDIYVLLSYSRFLVFQSHSSVLTDDEGAGAHFNRSGMEKLRAGYAQKKVGELQCYKEHCLGLMNFTSNTLPVIKSSDATS